MFRVLWFLFLTQKKFCMILLSFLLRERFNLFPFVIFYNFAMKPVKDEVYEKESETKILLLY